MVVMVVMGLLLQVVMVVTELPAISGTYGSLTPEERQRSYMPTHYLSLGELASEERGPIEMASRVELLDSFDVIDWTGPRGAHLYRLVYDR